MTTRKRILTTLVLGPSIFLACSGDNNGSTSDASSDQSNGVFNDASSTADAGQDGNGGGGSDGALAPVDGSTDADAATAADAPNVPGVDADAGSDAAVACSTPLYTHVSTFGSNLDGWTVAANSTASLVPVTGADGGMTGTLVALDPAVGSPAAPSVKLTIPFSQPGEQLLFAFNSALPLNLTGTTVTAQIKLDSGLSVSPLNPGQAYLVLKSTQSYIYAQGASVYLDPVGGFVTVTFDADAPTANVPGYSACDILEIDVIIQSGAVGTYTTAVVHIDTIAITAAGGDSGSDAVGPPVQSDAATDSSDAASDATTSGGG